MSTVTPYVIVKYPHDDVYGIKTWKNKIQTNSYSNFHMNKSLTTPIGVLRVNHPRERQKAARITLTLRAKKIIYSLKNTILGIITIIMIQTSLLQLETPSAPRFKYPRG